MSKLAPILLLGVLPVWADFSYQQTTKVTGGSIVRMMRFIPGGGKAFDPVVNTHLIKGNRMASITDKRMSVIDLDSETITEVDFEKKTYATMTFAEMREAMKQAQARMAQMQQQRQADAPQAEMNFKVDVKETGATRNIQGFDTKEMIMSIEAEVKDSKSGQSGTAMQFNADMWITKNIPGYDEVRKFYVRMAEKMGYTPESLSMGRTGAMQPGMGEGMARMAKEASKIDGVPVLQVTKVLAPGLAAAGDTQSGGNARQQQPGGPDIGAAAEREAARTAQNEAAYQASRNTGGRLGGLAGAAAGGILGGLGRKKQQSPPPQQQPPAEQPQQQQQQQQQQAAAGVLMEMSSELTSFSSASVDASRFAVPAGFKQVEHDMKKMTR